MSRKTNSKSLRIGINEIWPFFIQKYGNNFKVTTNLFYKFKKIINFTYYFFKLKNYFIDNIELKYYNYNIIFNIYVLNKLDKYNIKKILLNLTYFFYIKKNIKVFIFINKNKIYTSNILLIYINYLYYNLKYNIKKIFAIISLLLKKKLDSKTIIYAKKGPIFLKFKGYKIKLKGRLESQKSQMSKKLLFKKGSINLTKLNNYIDFKNIQIHTKLGICNFKIWIFYKII